VAETGIKTLSVNKISQKVNEFSILYSVSAGKSYEALSADFLTPSHFPKQSGTLILILVHSNEKYPMLIKTITFCPSFVNLIIIKVDVLVYISYFRKR
jgi:hypothetical protein